MSENDSTAQNITATIPAGPLVYPEWTSARVNDVVVRADHDGDLSPVGLITSAWGGTTGCVFEFGSSGGFVDVRPNVGNFASSGSLVRLPLADHLGLSLVRSVANAQVGDEVRDLDAARALPLGSLLCPPSGAYPTAVVSSDGTGKVLLSLTTGQPVTVATMTAMRILYLPTSG